MGDLLNSLMTDLSGVVTGIWNAFLGEHQDDFFKALSFAALGSIGLLLLPYTWRLLGLAGRIVTLAATGPAVLLALVSPPERWTTTFANWKVIRYLWLGALFVAAIALGAWGPVNLAIAVLWLAVFIVFVVQIEWARNEGLRDAVAQGVDKSTDPDALARLRDEALISAALLLPIFGLLTWRLAPQLPGLQGLVNQGPWIAMAYSLDQFLKSFVFDVLEIFNWSGFSGVEIDGPRNQTTYDRLFVAFMRTTYSIVTINALFQEVAFRRITREALSALPQYPARLVALGHRGRRIFASDWRVIRPFQVTFTSVNDRLRDQLGLLIAAKLTRQRRGKPAVAMAQALGELGDVARVSTLLQLVDEKTDEKVLRAAMSALVSLGTVAQRQLAGRAEKLPPSIANNLGWTLIDHGEFRSARGDITGATYVFDLATRVFQSLVESDASNMRWQRELGVAYDRLGDALAAQGDLQGAEEKYRASLALTERLVAIDPGNSEWQRDLSISHERIGGVLRILGDLERAKEHYSKGLHVAERLAASDPTNSEWQRDLSVSHNNLGDVLKDQGNLPGALEHHRKSLIIRERLAGLRRAPYRLKLQRQRDLMVCYDKIADVLRDQGDSPSALHHYRQALRIAIYLAGREPTNTLWQRDLSVCHNKVGDQLRAEGDLAGAEEQYRKSLDVAERLAAREPANTLWQRDLSIRYDSVGDLLRARGDFKGAEKQYRKGLAIAEQLAELDPTNTDWQRDLSISYNKIGEAQFEAGDLNGAERQFVKGFEIRKRLAETDPTNADWQHDLALSYARFGHLEEAKQNPAKALEHYRSSVAIIRSLCARFPGNRQWHDELEWLEKRIAEIESRSKANGTKAAADCRWMQRIDFLGFVRPKSFGVDALEIQTKRLLL